MRWSVEPCDGERGYLRVTTTGVFDTDDHVGMVEDILSRECWRPGMPSLFDHRALDWGETGFEQMMQASKTHQKHAERIGDGKTAILMGSIVAYGSGRQFQLLLSSQARARLGIFLDEAEALSWLLTGT